MANEYISKVIYGGNTLIDLTGDDVTAADVQSGKTFHLKDGSTTTGTNIWDSYTQDANAIAAEILSNKSAYVNKVKIEGTMPNRGAQIISITTINTSTPINNGYHDGSGYVAIDTTESAKIIPSNIKKGITVLGVEGDLTGEELVSVTTIDITPSINSQTYIPTAYSDSTGKPYDYFAQFTINAIPYVEIDNAAGGKTVTIAGN